MKTTELKMKLLTNYSKSMGLPLFSCLSTHLMKEHFHRLINHTLKSLHAEISRKLISPSVSF